jgi:hypothetical protein
MQHLMPLTTDQENLSRIVTRVCEGVEILTDKKRRNEIPIWVQNLTRELAEDFCPKALDSKWSMEERQSFLGGLAAGLGVPKLIGMLNSPLV